MSMFCTLRQSSFRARGFHFHMQETMLSEARMRSQDCTKLGDIKNCNGVIQNEQKR